MKNLQLSLKRKWFEMTRDGIKTEDYREITPYWCGRLLMLQGLPMYTKTFVILKADPSLPFVEMIGGLAGKSELTFKSFYTTTLTLGYPSATDTARIIKFEHAGIEIRTGNPEWGAEEGKLYFVIKHGKRIQ